MVRCFSLRCMGIVSAVLAIFAAFLPTMMSSMLRHMFTAPNQEPWSHGRLRLINCSGIPAQTLNSAERIGELKQNFEHRDGDVWISSYVKSGTTWTIGILAALYGHPAAEYSGNLLKTTRTFCPQPELPDLGWGDDGFGHSIENLNAWPANYPSRCFKLHWPSQDFVIPNGRSKFIYVMRNTYDQMVSHWNQVWGMGFHYGTTNLTFDGGWNEFVQDWIEGNVENGKWFDHVAGWYARSQKFGDVLFVRYEELRRNKEDVIRKIAKFVAVDQPNNEKMVQIFDLSSFERMKSSDQNDAGLKFMRWLSVLRKNHIRQGGIHEINNRKLMLSTEQRKALEQEYDNKLKPLGLPRDWVFLD